MKISNREKRLLFILALIIVVFGGYSILVKPLNDKKNQLTTENTQLEIEKLVMQTKIRSASKYEDEITLNKEEVEKILNQISDPIDTKSFDNYLTALLLKHAVAVEKVNYAPLEAVVPASIDYKSPIVEYELKELINIYLEGQGNEETLATTDVTILKQSVNVEFVGKLNQLRQIISDLNSQTETLFISSITYDNENQKYSFVIDIYSVDKINDKGSNDLGVIDRPSHK